MGPGTQHRPHHQSSELPGHRIRSLLSTHATVPSSSWVAFSSWAGITLDLDSVDRCIRQLWYDRHFNRMFVPQTPNFKTNYQNTYAVCTPMFKAALFTITKTWKQSKCPLTDGFVVVVQLLSHVGLFATSLPITNSWSLLKLMSIELVMLSNRLILCHPLLLLLSIFPTIRVFSNESGLHIR